MYGYTGWILWSIIGVVSTVGSEEGFATQWDYNSTSNIGPENWKNYAPKCGGSMQSPINIITRNAQYNSSLTPLILEDYGPMSGATYRIANVGATVALTFENSVKKNILKYQGTSWKLNSLHFHWGKDNKTGSEHKKNGKSFPLEFHMVHFNSKYSDEASAKTKPDGLLVWAHYMKVNGTISTNMDYENLIRHFSGILFEGDSTNIPAINMATLIPTGSESNYYTYVGSLTTPTCDETVTWIINRKFVEINQEQMDKFRTMHPSSNLSDTRQIADNFRPIQNLNGRIVTKSFEGSDDDGDDGNDDDGGNSSAGVYMVASLMVLFGTVSLGFACNI